MRAMQELGEWEERDWDSSPCFPPYVVCLPLPKATVPSRKPTPDNPFYGSHNMRTLQDTVLSLDCFPQTLVDSSQSEGVK